MNVFLMSVNFMMALEEKSGDHHSQLASSSGDYECLFPNFMAICPVV